MIKGLAGWFLIAVQIFLWIGGGILITSYFQIESTLLMVAAYGFTGISAMFLCTMIAIKLNLTK